MFTGLIEEVGTDPKHKTRNQILCPDRAVKRSGGTKVGDSIATNGVCLTVTELGLRLLYCGCNA